MPRAISALRRWFDKGWLEGHVEIAEQIFASDVVVHLADSRAVGADALEWVAKEISRLDDITGSCNIVGDEREQCATYAVRGTPTDAFFGADATGRTLHIRAIVTAEARRGRIIEVWQTWAWHQLAPANNAAATWARSWSLSPKEALVAQLVMGGLSDKQVAKELDLAASTVSKHVRRVLSKAQVGSRADLAVRAGIVRLG